MLSPDVTPLLTALWVIVITNAVNLIDGLDGLAAGIVAIASGALAVYGLRLMDLGVLPADNLGPLIAVIAFGVCVGFLPHNFHPARVFMGDAGALFLGLLMAAATMVIGGRTPDVSGQTYFFFAPLFIPVFILGVPIADMAFAFIRRTAKGTGVPHAGQGPRAPPPAAPGPRPETDGRDPVGVDGGPVGVRALPAVRQAGQRRHPLRGHRPGPRALHLVPPRSAQGTAPTAPRPPQPPKTDLGPTAGGARAREMRCRPRRGHAPGRCGPGPEGNQLQTASNAPGRRSFCRP